MTLRVPEREDDARRVEQCRLPIDELRAAKLDSGRVVERDLRIVRIVVLCVQF
ncbi:MAG: hypothetical protein ACJ796_18000 [Gemmatimonadaceae bacterium]